MAAPVCPFCAVIAGQDPNVREIYRDANTVAFFPLEPATHGHTLIVPTRHVPDMWSLRDAELAPLSATTLKVAKAIRDSLMPDGLNIIQSNGQAATQTIDHLHVHLIPRWNNDRMPAIWPVGTDETDATLDRAARQITAALPSTAGTTVSPDDRRQHLGFIQSVVTRMAQSSATAKSWLLPIVTATYGFAITKEAPLIAVIGIVAVLVFALLDANYLKQERAFRALYDKVAEGSSIPEFSMNPTLAAPAGRRSNYWPDWQDWRSWAVMPFYLPLLVSGVVIAVLYTWVW
ncbi:HIT domain-containing protein [Nocardia vinacea]|uniref:HIT domain-containing protein n=1 Tax=Nocardia vinacea TaxID=96468 RepID=A0ABZ1Z407_9NOCA|nr:HIT domain-containing protein [Nocardia vinacea]